MLNGLAAFTGSGRWFKGNLHCHTTLSDGEVEPNARIEQYRELGYDFLSITDHSIVTPDVARDDGDFVVLSGTEVHPAVPWTGQSYHIVVPKVPDDFEAGVEKGPLRPILRQLARRKVPFFIGHPYWCGNDVGELLPLASLALGVEVYNTATLNRGRALSASEWDAMLTRGFPLSGVAVDDAHKPRLDVGAAWTMIRSEELSTAGIMEALVAGRFYASTGPAIQAFSFDSGVLSVRTDPVQTINFISTPIPFMRGHATWDERGGAVTEAHWELPGDFSGYVRAECHIDLNHSAWTNPVFFKDGVVVW